jgi:hypothetical protein
VSEKFKQKQPCKTCPWSRKIEPGQTGGAHPFKFIGQAEGPFWLPCHSSPGYEEDRRNQEHRQCAGAAMYRDLAGIAERLPDGLHRLEGDAELVFASPAEFLAHHAKMKPEEAEEEMLRYPPSLLLQYEMAQIGVQPMFRRKP